jgi:hypothetical protein
MIMDFTFTFSESALYWMEVIPETLVLTVSAKNLPFHAGLLISQSIKGSNSFFQSMESSSLVSLLAFRYTDFSSRQLLDMLFFMSGGSSVDLPRQSTNEETEQSIDRSNSPQMQAFFVAQAVAYLERCFRDIVQSKVNANLKQARLGGQLGTLALCSAYLRLSVSEKYHLLSVEKFDGDGGQQQPLWPTIYLCLRCGDAEAARNVALKVRPFLVSSIINLILI